MKRRTFFKTLGKAVAAAAGLAIAPKLLTISAPTRAAGRVARIKYYAVNPEWVMAKYEFAFFHISDARYLTAPFPRTLTPDLVKDGDVWRARQAVPFPCRGNQFDAEGKLIVIPPFIGMM